MHDARGRELKVGDQVLIPAVVTDLQATEDYCNCTVETLAGRRPDGAKERFSAINTGVVFRANDDDDNDFSDLAPPAPAEEPLAAGEEATDQGK